MAKKKKDILLVPDEQIEMGDGQKAQQPNTETKFLATEWARQDPDQPDPALFIYWDARGTISCDDYQDVKSKVYRKK